jgi:cardiolipin synthase
MEHTVLLPRAATRRNSLVSIPMLLTWGRLVAIPLFASTYFLPISELNRDLIATVIFVAAAITDYFDGWLARRLNQESDFGGFLDPVADKLIVCTALVFLIDLNRVAPIIASIILTREIFISALREWMAKVGKSSAVGVDWFGKMKTRMQLIGVSLLLYDGLLFGIINCRNVGRWAILIAAALTVLSMAIYVVRAIKQLRYADAITGL